MKKNWVAPLETCQSEFTALEDVYKRQVYRNVRRIRKEKKMNAVSTYQSPLGELLLAADEEGLTGMLSLIHI